MRVEKSVFISYRRTNIFHARSVYQYLKSQGYDVFLDYESLDNGAFDQIILSEIAARAHFVLILTPSALERCTNSEDWLRREIEHAMELQRNIVPLMFDRFDYRDVKSYLVGKLELLPNYNSVEIPSSFFNEAMARLVDRFLNKPLDTVLHPTTQEHQKIIDEKKLEIEHAPKPTFSQEEAERYFEQGFARALKHDFVSAIEDYTKAIELNSNYVEAYYRRANAYWNTGEKHLSLKDYQRAIDIDPHDPKVPVMRSAIYSLQENHLRALEQAQLGVEQNPEYADAYFRRAYSFHSLKKYADAIMDYDKVIEIKEDYAVAYYNRAIIRKEQSEIQLALSDYDRTIDIDPLYTLAYFNRALIHDLSLNDSESALLDYNKVIELDPDDSSMLSDSYLNRGLIYNNREEYNLALESYNKAIEINPNSSIAYNNRGNLYKSRGNPDAAIRDFTRSLKIDPMSAMTYRNRARTYTLKGKIDAALSDWQASLLYEPDNKEAKDAVDVLKVMKVGGEVFNFLRSFRKK